MAEANQLRPLHWVMIALIVVAIVCLLAYRRGDPGVGDRVPDPEDAVAEAIVSGTDPA